MAAKPLINDADLIQVIQNVLEEWHSKNDEPTLRKNIHTRLDKDKDQILMKLLGFNKNSWSHSWELDHCNGRAGNSIAGDYLKDVQHKAINDWLSLVELPSLTKVETANIQKQYKHAFMQSLEKRLIEHAHTAASESAEKIFKDLVKAPDIDKYLQTMNLLLPATE